MATEIIKSLKFVTIYLKLKLFTHMLNVSFTIPWEIFTLWKKSLKTSLIKKLHGKNKSLKTV